MSVINRMLSQLDERRAAAPDLSATGIAGAVEAVPRPAQRRLGWLVLGGTAVVSAAAFAQWPVMLSKPSSAPQPLVLAQDAGTKVALNSAAAAATDAAPTVTDSQAAPPAAAQAVTKLPTVIRRADTRAHADAVRPATATTPRRASAASVAVAMVSMPTLSIKDTPFNFQTPAPAEASAATPTTLTTRATTAAAVTTAAARQVAYAPVSDTGSVEKRVIPPSAAQRASIAYQQAVEQAASGHSNPAIAKALDALNADPDHTAARELAAVLMIESKRLGDAAALMREGLARQPQQPHLIMLLARIEAESGSAQAALDRLSAAPGLDGDGHGLRAALLARAQRYREAANAYEAAVRLQPDNASWWFGLGVALDANGQAPLARQALQRARAIGSLRGDALAYVDQKLAAQE